MVGFSWWRKLDGTERINGSSKFVVLDIFSSIWGPFFLAADQVGSPRYSAPWVDEFRRLLSESGLPYITLPLDKVGRPVNLQAYNQAYREMQLEGHTCYRNGDRWYFDDEQAAMLFKLRVS